jgi:hypothetical protein
MVHILGVQLFENNVVKVCARIPFFPTAQLTPLLARAHQLLWD